MELPYFAYAWLHHGEGNVAFHCHGGCEILLVTRGKCRVESSSGILEGVPGTLIVIPPGVRHNQINEPGERNLFCVFQASPGLFSQRWRRIDVSGLGWVRRSLLELWRMMELGNLTGAPALLFMQDHFTEELSIEETARKAGICPSFLRRLFQDFCGESPLQYLRNLRLERSRILLRNPYLSIAEIAERCGFGDSNYFIRIYKSRYGITPRKDRPVLSGRS